MPGGRNAVGAKRQAFLRHEYASRLIERGVPLAQVRDLLGHASITTTERYDNQDLEIWLGGRDSNPEPGPFPSG